MAMLEFVEAARVDQIPPGTGTTIKVADKEIAIFNVGGNFYAIGDSCPHASASLGWGKLGGKVVICRAHGLRFDVTTGQVTTGRIDEVRLH
jgi:3-phenylpropionate/trans-cinnamate dioxygenase ferredoxin component